MKKIIHITLSILFLAMMLSSCRKQDAYYVKYYQIANEYRYPQVLESFAAKTGYYKAQLSWTKTVDPSLIIARIFWNNGKDSIEVDLKNLPVLNRNVVAVTIDGLSEAPYSFVAYTFDSEGRRSLPAEAAVSIRGDEYAATLSTRNIVSVSSNGTEILITWGAPTKNLAYCEIEYISKSEGTKVIKVNPDQLSTLISDFDFNVAKDFRYRSVYILEDSFEPFGTPWVSRDVTN